MKVHDKNKKIFLDSKKDKNKDKFTIYHSAKEVKYDVKSFVEKNIDEISSSLTSLMVTKTNPIVQNILKMKVPELPVSVKFN
jgi:myosin heavy subunit